MEQNGHIRASQSRQGCLWGRRGQGGYFIGMNLTVFPQSYTPTHSKFISEIKVYWNVYWICFVNVVHKAKQCIFYELSVYVVFILHFLTFTDKSEFMWCIYKSSLCLSKGLLQCLTSNFCTPSILFRPSVYLFNCICIFKFQDLNYASWNVGWKSR